MIGLLSLVAVAAPIAQPDTIPQPTVITLEQAIEIALSENISVKVADQEIARTQYAKRGTYASLFPQIDGSASYKRTIKRQGIQAPRQRRFVFLHHPGPFFLFFLFGEV